MLLDSRNQERRQAFGLLYIDISILQNKFTDNILILFLLVNRMEQRRTSIFVFGVHQVVSFQNVLNQLNISFPTSEH